MKEMKHLYRYVAILTILMVAGMTEMRADDDIPVKKNADGTWTFVRTDQDVELEIEYYTPEELSKQASKAISLRTAITRNKRTNVRSLVAYASTADGGTLSYQWYSNTSSSNTDGTPIEGATTARYALPTENNEVEDLYYYCVVTNDNGVAIGSRTGRVLGLKKAAASDSKPKGKRSRRGRRR